MVDNLGTVGDFNLTNGEFSVNKNGTFLFMLDGTSDQLGERPTVYIRVNGEAIKLSSADGQIKPAEVSGMIATELVEGDVVTVSNEEPNKIRGDSYLPFTFMCTLIPKFH